jgi:hypothetical protein
MNKKKLIIILAIVCFVLVVIALMPNGESEREQVVSNPAELAMQVSPLPIPTKSDSPRNVAFNTNIVPSQSDAMYYRYRLVANQPKPETVAGALGFESEPSVTKDVFGNNFYRYSESGKGSLTVTEDPIHVGLLYNLEITKPPALSDSRTEESITDYLRTNKMIGASTKLIRLDGEFIKTNGYNPLPAASAKEANYTMMKFAYEVDGTPLYMSVDGVSSINASVNSDGTIRTLSMYYPPDIERLSEAELIGFETALYVLSQNKGYLVEAVSNFYSEVTDVPLFTKAEIKDYEIVYLLLPDTDVIVPAYQFVGKAPHETNKRITYDIIYLVPATQQ